ncbi:MAG: adenylate/guanylate cyclase domain-containing protein [Armatimonadota bacterium]
MSRLSGLGYATFARRGGNSKIPLPAPALPSATGNNSTQPNFAHDSWEVNHASLPIGTVTFLFTDIEGSTRLVQELGDRHPDILESHRRILRSATAEQKGYEFETQGDGLFVVQQMGPGPLSVLDCSCGIGTQAIGLARLG